jgi:cell division protein FtsQ
MKLDKQKILRTIGLLLVMGLVVAGFVGANFINRNSTVKAIDINIGGGQQSSFLSSKELYKELITSRNIAEGITKIRDIDIDAIEKVATNNPWVKRASVYVGNDRKLHINIEQRRPVLQLINGESAQYYLDEDAQIIPLNVEHAVPVPVVTSTLLGYNSEHQNLRKQLVHLANFIGKDTFWNDMITQINVDKNLVIELIPLVANHTILFGDTSAMSDKFARLYSFYKDAIPKQGWDKFSQVDVRNVGQIVASKPIAAGTLGATAVSTEVSQDAISERRVAALEAPSARRVAALANKQNSTLTTSSKADKVAVKKPSTTQVPTKKVPIANTKVDAKKTLDKKVVKEQQKVNTKPAIIKNTTVKTTTAKTKADTNKQEKKSK